MLTGKLVRVRYARDRIVPAWIDTQDPVLQETADRLLELYRGQEGRTRAEIEQEHDELFGDDPGQLVPRGLAKLLEDRCEFEVVSGHPPEQLRKAVFLAAAAARAVPAVSPREIVPFDKQKVLGDVAAGLGIQPSQVEDGLFADLKSEQRLVRFRDISADHLLERYNVGLAQAVLLRAVGVRVDVDGEPPPRLRQLLRLVKFHRLVCEVESVGPTAVRLQLDGPLSLFSATQKYGLQLAMFLPAVLACKTFTLKAELRWGPEKKPKTMLLSHKDGLTPHGDDRGLYVPPELGMFAALFRKKVVGWDLVEETAAIPLGGHFWVPDFRLVERETGRAVLLDVLGFWRKSSALAHLQRLREHAREPFVLAVSDQFHVEDEALTDFPTGIHRFRQMPLPDEIVRLAREALAARPG